jgi:hypothetical protein
VAKEHQFWTEKLSQIIKGHKESDVEDIIVRWVKEVDLANISEEEREGIFSEIIEREGHVGRVI